MRALGRRLDALEGRAEEARTRPIRRMLGDLAREHHLSRAEADEMIREGIEMTDRLASERDARLRAGWSGRQIVRDYAERAGMTVAEFEAESERLAAVYWP